MGVAAQVAENSSAWDRCRRAGLSRELTEPRRFQPSQEIELLRRRSPLSRIASPVKQALARATSHDHVLILTDPQGSVLSRFGTRSAITAAAGIGFEEGADWSEASVGTNAISEALRLSRPAYVTGEGHFAYSHAYWTCMAAPIHCPTTGALLGVLDVSGPRSQLGRDVIGMVRMTALLAQEMLRLTEPEPLSTPSLRLRLLGPRPAISAAAGQWRKLSTRTAEILALLSVRTRGFTAAELALELYGEAGRPATVRAEMHRLRKRLGPVVSSEPYRFAEEMNVITDVGSVQDALARSDVEELLQHYTQPLLPASTAESITAWRAGLNDEANRLVADYGSTDQRARWSRTEMAWSPVATMMQPSATYSERT
ncbi:helix-turn-helix domain-containing protein [Nesterenkonia sp.]|uniref:helix-turn-helix domain-containing protein n=1 Tax=Nesterenkonia sp. TaxID=704201 RepID=UPI002634EF99|nr:helix-turn-helix domain-containing protein [Nesterenkonia sp.]